MDGWVQWVKTKDVRGYEVGVVGKTYNDRKQAISREREDRAGGRQPTYTRAYPCVSACPSIHRPAEERLANIDMP